MQLQSISVWTPAIARHSYAYITKQLAKCPCLAGDTRHKGVLIRSYIAI